MGKINKRYDRRTAVSVVIANMIGTGVFTSLGFQLLDIHSAPVILPVSYTHLTLPTKA